MILDVMRRVAIILVVLPWLGCDNTAAPESIPLIQPPRFSVFSLDITDYPGTKSIWIRISGTLDLGRRADGTLSSLADRCLYVMGFGFCPSESRYDAGAWLPESAFEAQPFLRAPAIEGLGTPPELTWSLPHRLGSDTVGVGSADGPVLRLTPAVGGAEIAIGGWQLTVPIVPPPFRGPGDRIVRSGLGPPPTEITIPDDVLTISEPTTVTLGYGVDFRYEASRVGEYVIGGHPQALASTGSVYHQWVLLPKTD